MTLSENVQSSLEANVRRKDEVVKLRTAEENDDVEPCVDFWRNGDCLLVVVAPEVDKYQALQAIDLVVPLMRCDAVVLTVDTHMSNHALSPDGLPWKPGEMQQRCDAEGLCEIDYITDAISTIGLTKAGDAAMMTRAYHVNVAAREVHWKPRDDELQVMSPTAKVKGLLPDSIRDALRAVPPLVPMSDGEKLGSLIAALTSTGYQALLTTQDSDLRAGTLETVNKLGLAVEEI